MENALHVHRLETHFHLAHGASRQRDRLKKVLRSTLDDTLEVALERAGVPVHELVCIQRLHVPIHLRLRDTDATLSATLGMSLAEKIRATIENGGPNVVRFHSRRHALVDLASSVLRGDLSRGWAWRQLGLWEAPASLTRGERAREVARVLSAREEATAAVLGELAAMGELDELIDALPEPAWVELARAVVARSTGGTVSLGVFAASGVLRESPELHSWATKQLARSAIARSWRRQPVQVSERAHQATALLVLTETEPSFLLVAGPRLSEKLSALVLALRQESETRVAECGLPAGVHGVRLHGTRAPGSKPSAPAAETAPHPDSRARGQTQWAGTLFLLHLVKADALTTDPLFAERPFRWVMHELALVLSGAKPGDPAALAFAGLPPDAPSPSKDEPARTEVEHQRLTEWANELWQALRVRLGKPEATPTWLRGLINRRAEVVADPGWFDVHLRLDEVSIDIRRAGLDLDLGYLPWLGVVVRFLYA